MSSIKRHNTPAELESLTLRDIDDLSTNEIDAYFQILVSSKANPLPVYTIRKQSPIKTRAQTKAPTKVEAKTKSKTNVTSTSEAPPKPVVKGDSKENLLKRILRSTTKLRTSSPNVVQPALLKPRDIAAKGGQVPFISAGQINVIMTPDRTRRMQEIASIDRNHGRNFNERRNQWERRSFRGA